MNKKRYVCYNHYKKNTIEGGKGLYSGDFYGVNKMGHIYSKNYRGNGKRVCVDVKRNVSPKERQASKEFIDWVFGTIANFLNQLPKNEKEEKERTDDLRTTCKI